MFRSNNKKASGVYRFSYSLLAVLLFLTVGASLTFYRNAAGKEAAKFNATASRLQTEIENKVNLYVTLLAGVRGFIRTAPNLNKSSFAEYVDSLHLKSNYPALLRVGYVQTVPASDVAAYRSYMAGAGYPNLNLASSPDRSEYDFLAFVEPRTEVNQFAIGFDMASDPDRRTALETAATTGKAVMSGRLKPIIETSPNSDVIAIFLPIFVEGDEPSSDATKARATDGFVYTSFTPAGFVQDIEKVQLEKDVAIQIFDGDETGPNLLAETQRVEPELAGLFGDRQTLTSQVSLAGRTWTTRFSSLPAFNEHSALGWTPLIFVAGIFFSFVVFGFTYHDASRRNELQKLTGELLVTQKEKESLFEQEQHARLEAEEANRAKDEFLAIVSHELKTPLNTIGGWTTILRSDHLSAATKDTALRKIEKNLRLQAKMVEQILEFSQIMSDKVAVNFQPVSASALFDAAVASIEGSAAEKRISLVSINELNGEVINADAERLDLAIENVLANAVKFTLPGGKIEAHAYAEDGEVRFVVKDNGSGIDPNFLPHVFEQYRQGDKPAVRSYGGLGLGLAITKHIVEMHGGTTESASPGLGHGAEFTLRVPIRESSETVS